MTKDRLEAFSDGVVAILITIMVLELRPPDGATWSALVPLLPVLLSYLLSFIFLAIYWNNHHHLFQAIEQVNGGVLWANMHLLFWLSLIPFVTAWMGQNSFAPQPVALYGLVLLMAAAAFTILVRMLIRLEGRDSLLARAIGNDAKGKLSLVLYAVAVAVALFAPGVSCAIYVIVAIMWLIPDRRIEKKLTPDEGKSE